MVTERIKDIKWEKHGRVPREGRAVLVCKKCGQRVKRRGLTPARAMATAQHVPVEEDVD